MWDGGLPAPVDGLRFVVPVHSTSTCPSPEYYGCKRGVTWLDKGQEDQLAAPSPGP